MNRFRGESARLTPTPAPPYLAAVVAAGLVWALYVRTLAPSVAFWDAGDYITTAHILGIPHPPGNPLFVLLAHGWEILLSWTGLSVAVRINLFSATMSAAAAGLWFLVAHRILAFFTELEWVRRLGAGAAMLVSATAFTVWNQSNVNEKVYTVSLFTIALLSWLAFRWRDRVETAPSAAVLLRPLVLMAFILALSVGNHLMALLAAPALALLLLQVRPRFLARRRFYLGVGAAVVLGLSVHLYLPLRAGMNPVINEASPTCETVGGALASILTFGRAGCENLSAALSREQYAKPPLSERLSPFGSQIANYLQYFDWQWARSLDGRRPYFSTARLPITLLFAALGIWGALEHRRRDRKSFMYLAVLFTTLSAALVFYMNFEYGFTQVQALGLPIDRGEVRDRDYFFLVSFSVWGIWVGIGLTALWLHGSTALRARGRSPMWAAPVFTLALIPLALNWSYATRSGDYAARDFAYNLLQSVEPYGILFTSGDNDTLPLWYLQEVEGYRRDVTVVQTGYLNAGWYARQLRDLTRPCPRPDAWKDDPTRILCQRSFEPERAPGIYAPRPKPADSILPLTDAQVAAVESRVVMLPRDVVFEAEGIRTSFAANTQLTPSDQLALAIIKHGVGKRPIHFSSVPAARQLGFGRHIARHGLTLKLVTPGEAEGLLPLEGSSAELLGAYLDRERTERLLWNELVYRDVLDRAVWADDSTRNVPGYYLLAHLTLASALDDPSSAKNLARAARWEALSNR